KFIINRFNIRDEEMVTLHIPLALSTYLVRLRSHFTANMVNNADERTLLQSAFEIIERLVQCVPDRAFKEKAADAHADEDSLETTFNTLTIIQEFYTD